MERQIKPISNKKYYGERATPEYQKAIESFRVLPELETIAKANIINDNTCYHQIVAVSPVVKKPTPS
jgi:hypothetical protein